jgi:hypothetical protein
MELRDECAQDELMAAIYENMFINDTTPRYRELIDTLQFFAIFSIGSTRIGAFKVAEKMNWRMDLYVRMLLAKGYTYGRRTSHQKTWGLDDIFNRAFYLNFGKLWE